MGQKISRTMPLTRTWTLVLAAGLVGGFAQTAAAQVAPPPPPPSEPEPEYIPPPPPPPPSAERVTAPRQPTRPQFTFDPIAQYDADGNFVPLEGDPYLAALRNNPIVRDSSRELILEVVRERRRTLEKRLVANVDVLSQIENGMLRNFSFDDIQQATQMTQLVQTLVLQPGLDADLRERSIISRVQADVTGQIVREYRNELNQVRRGEGGEQRLTAMLVGVIEDSLVEAMAAYKGLLEEASTQLDAVVPAAQLAEAEEAAALRALGPTGSPNQVREALKPLTPDQLAAFIEGVVAQREDPDMAPLPEISFEPPESAESSADDAAEGEGE